MFVVQTMTPSARENVETFLSKACTSVPRAKAHTFVDEASAMKAGAFFERKGEGRRFEVVPA